jgi:hypothetical protein
MHDHENTIEAIDCADERRQWPLSC